jgi:hypothetical protein
VALRVVGERHLEENVAAAALALTEEDLAELAR